MYVCARRKVNNLRSIIFCIVFKHLYSASSGMNHSEALPVNKACEKK